MWNDIATVAQTAPDRIALVDGARRVTYGALWCEVRRVAAALRASGLTQGERVAIVLPTCIDAVVARYGTWLAGGVAAPLDGEAGVHELERCLSECDARFIVRADDHPALDHAIHALATPPDRIEWSHGDGTAWEVESAFPPPRAPRTPARLALLLYTEGTTRRPKAVMLSYANLLADVHAMTSHFALGAADRVVTTLPIHRARGASLVHAHLGAGACVVLAPNDVPAHGIAEIVSRERATLPSARLFTTYGQTEATAQLTAMPPEPLDEKVGSVGVPIVGVRLEIRRKGGERALPGEVGDIWVTGDNVMIGYLNDPAATRAAIRDGWLDTGDRGYVDRDGFLFLSGRRSVPRARRAVLGEDTLYWRRAEATLLA